MPGLIPGLAGAGGAANTAGGFYNTAGNNVVNAYGSPAANMFSKEYISSLQPGFQQQQQGLLGDLAAHGITNSGAAKADLTNLYTGESGAEAAGIAPLYSQALGQYGSIQQAGAGAQTQAYQNAVNQFYQALEDAGNDVTGGSSNPSGASGGSSGGGFNPYTSDYAAGVGAVA